MRLPGNLLNVMEAELDTGALTLSQAHVRNLDEYAKYVRGLPNSPADLTQWLGGVPINQGDAELDRNSMMSFFFQLKEHANRWEVLFGKNLQLTAALAAVASKINTTGSTMLEACEQTKALGKRREAWDALQGGELVQLSPTDRQIVSTLPKHVNTLKGKLTEYSGQVGLVRVEVQRFRDEARMQLIPAAARKVKGVEKYKKPTTRDFSPATMALVNLQLRIRELSERLQKMESLLREVLTASSHFHSAWQSLTAYIDASAEQLQQITTGQQLARFAIYFGRFLGQWSTIEQSAREMKRKLTRLHA
ncbi:hypothetical protein [Pseudomonas putida]|uniref:hypothetical protein n=1 Tax=Pseudomonas putida TaxID=303 RepID=UPI002365FB1F|nr:hypothetical protein [Pseudomonas putida]MDD2047855.1 hypothetical protein [Pseudomonas putida]